MIYMEVSFKSALSIHRSGNITNAIHHYHELLKKIPNNFELLHLLGIAYGQQKEFSHSLEYLKQALIHDPTHHGLLSNIGTAYKGLNKYNEALKYFQKALKICPGMCSTLNNIGSLFHLYKINLYQ